MDKSEIPNGVRVDSSTGYHRVEGNRRASRNGPVSPSYHPMSHTFRFAAFASLAGRGGCRRARAVEPGPGCAVHGVGGEGEGVQVRGDGAVILQLHVSRARAC
jgi:hypothetical protein